MNKKLLTLAFALVMAVVLSGAVAAAGENTVTDETSYEQLTTTSSNTALPDPYNTRTCLSYTTIQAAIDDMMTHDGDTIQCEAGIYNEDVLVWKDLTIVGADATTTFVNSFYISETGSGSDISKFTVTGGTGHAIILDNATECNIHDNIISGGYNAAIALTNSDNNIIQANRIDDSIARNYYGIYLEYSANNMIDGNIITKCNFDGIWLLESDNNRIGTNSINQITDNEKGIKVTSSDDNVIRYNVISGNTYNGIEVTQSDRNIINNNMINDSITGIYLWSSNDNDIGWYNYIKGPGTNVANSCGISINDSSGNSILGCDIGVDGDYSQGFVTGIKLENSDTIIHEGNIWNCAYGMSIGNSSATLHSPYIANNNFHGIIVGGAVALTIDDSYGTGAIITGNHFCGVTFGDEITSCSVSIKNTTISHNGHMGIHFDFGNDVIIENNDINYNNYAGIYLNFIPNVQIINNKIHHNNAYGIYAINSDNLQILNNSITHNGDDGIYLESCDDFEIKRNGMDTNTDDGVEVSDSTGGEIYNNIIIYNLDGVKLSNCMDMVIKHNEIIFNTDHGIAINESDNVSILENDINTNGTNVSVATSQFTNVNMHFNRIGNYTSISLWKNGSGSLDATLNWWCYNDLAHISAMIANGGTGLLVYDPWIVLSISANPSVVSIGGTSTITADLLHDSDGFYHNPLLGLVPWIGPAQFTTDLGTIADANFSNGMATSTLTNLNTAGTANVSATVDYPTVWTAVTVNPGATIAQIIAAAGQVKAFYEANGVLPANVMVGAQSLTMPQFLYLLVTATGNVNVGNLNPINFMAVNPATAPSGSYTHGNLQKASYLTVANNIRNFILTNGRAPNYAQTSLGKVPFAKLVYMYSKVMKFYGNIIPNRLPNYVYI